MAGFGKSIANALIGAAGGYGDYLTTQGKIQEEGKIEQAKAGRAMALEEFRAKMQGDRDAILNQNDRDKIVLTGAVNRSNNQAELATKATVDEAADKRDFDIWKQKNNVEFGQWKTKSGIELSNAQKLELFKSEQEAKTAATKEGLKPVGDDIDEKTGSRVLYFRDGQNNVRAYDTGIVVQQKSETNPITGDVSRTTNAPTAKPRTGWRDDSSAAAGPAKPGGRQVMSSGDYSKAVADATRLAAKGDPRFKGLNAGQIRQKLQDIYARAGYDLPPIT